MAIQFGSHVLPPSVENACSNLEDVGVISILRQLGVRDRTRAVLKALERGYV